MSKSESKSYLIVGAGIFGAATALELCKTFPDVKVTLLDRAPYPNPSAASSDVNKIIRADYPEIFYMKLALEAQKWWREDPLYKPFFHETGLLYAENKGFAQLFFDNYKKLGYQPDSETFPVEEGRRRFDGVFRDANWSGVTHNYFNPRSGWGEGDNALRALVQAAVDHGAEYKTATVSSLLLSDDRTCRGVRLEGDEQLLADHVVLSAGAWTPWILAESAPSDDKINLGERVVVAGAIQCRATVPEEAQKKLRSAPILVNCQSHTEGESIPPTPDNWLKSNYEMSFTNKELHLPSRQIISVPPKATGKTTWSQEVPETLKAEVQRVVRHAYGSWINGLKIEDYRMCWDAVTPNQDWIICAHPYCENLSIATGGSFHSWKFMPLLGRFVVQMLRGTLDDESARRWAWDRDNSGGALPEYIPKRDLKDLL